MKYYGYYAFEYSILMRLHEIFLIKDIETQKEVEEAHKTMRDEFGKLHDMVISKLVVGNSIQINFCNDFHIKFSRDSLIQAYEEKCEVENVVRRLQKFIENKWLRRIYK